MTISAFLSYSRKDEAVARQLESDLERGRVSVWRDSELRGGDLWWQKILEQIRACDVFVLALSNNGLASKPCRAELAYARELGVPVLPVQIGPVDTLRTAPVGELQVLDYRQQNAASGVALFAELDAAASRKGPLPDPLPPAPAVPFAYLLRLGSAIEQEQLTPAEQNDLVGQLRDCLDTEDDEDVKNDARELLRALRHRSDVTYKHAGDIDQLLAGSTTRGSSAPSAPSVPKQGDAGARRSAAPAPTAAAMGSGPRGYAPGPPPPGYGQPAAYGTPQPRPQGYQPGTGGGFYPPPGRPGSGRKSRAPMLLVSGAVVIAGAVVGGVLLLGPNSGSGSGTDPTNPSTTDPGPPPPDPGDQLLAVLPGDFDANSCSSGQLAGDGDVAALSCGQAFTQPGPTAATFRLYPSGTVDGVFLNDMSQNGIPALGPGQVCPDFLGYGGYTVDGGVRGRAACFIGPDNTSYVAWTDDGEGTEGVATIANGGGAGVYTLWNWWADPDRAAFGP